MPFIEMLGLVVWEGAIWDCQRRTLVVGSRWSAMKVSWQKETHHELHVLIIRSKGDGISKSESSSGEGLCCMLFCW